MDNLLAEFPLVVGYPETGPRVIVRWYAHEQGNKLITSHDEAGALDMWQAVLKRCYRYGIGDIAEIKEYSVCEVVPPPLEARQVYAQTARRDDIQQFAQWLWTLAMQHQPKHWLDGKPLNPKKLPEGFIKCPETHKPEWVDWCPRCNDEEFCYEVPYETLYDNPEIRVLWHERDAERDPKDVPVAQPVPQEGTERPTFVAVLEVFGSTGITLDTYDQWLKNPCGGKILFFARGELGIAPDGIPDAFAAARKSYEDAKAAAATAEVERMKAYRKEEAAGLLADLDLLRKVLEISRRSGHA